MSKQASIHYNGSTYDLPIIDGSEGECAIDIKSLRSTTQLITLDPGFKNTGSCESSITFLDGEKGILHYRGYPIEELAQKANFLEVAYLLIFGELPTQEQHDAFLTDIKEESYIDEDLKKILESFPKSAHPMGVLSSLTSALTALIQLLSTLIQTNRCITPLFELWLNSQFWSLGCFAREWGFR